MKTSFMPMLAAPGRISASAFITSRTFLGPRAFKRCRIAGDSSWLQPTVSADWSRRIVAGSDRGSDSMSIRSPVRRATRSQA